MLVVVGERLKSERGRLGFSQEKFAKVGGISKISQYNYESGKRSPDANYFAAIAKAGVDIQYVITGARCVPSKDELSPQEGALIEKYRLLSDSNKALLQAVVGAFADKGSDIKKRAK